jgi:hypothetical protein
MLCSGIARKKRPRIPVREPHGDGSVKRGGSKESAIVVSSSAR